MNNNYQGGWVYVCIETSIIVCGQFIVKYQIFGRAGDDNDAMVLCLTKKP